MGEKGFGALFRLSFIGLVVKLAVTNNTDQLTVSRAVAATEG